MQVISRRKALRIIGFSTLSMASVQALGFQQTQELALDNCRFVWWRDASRLRCTFVAPARGWVAVGFGPTLDIIGTRFVMADPQLDKLRFVEMLAAPTGPMPYPTGSQVRAFQAITGGRDTNSAWVSFAMALPFFNGETALVRPKQKANLMLAWSTSTDFAHHSAWRRHIKIDV